MDLCDVKHGHLGNFFGNVINIFLNVLLDSNNFVQCEKSHHELVGQYKKGRKITCLLHYLELAILNFIISQNGVYNL